MDDILLMLPGPTTVDPRVLAAMSKAVVNHSKIWRNINRNYRINE